MNRSGDRNGMDRGSCLDGSHGQMKGLGELSSETPSFPSITAAHKYHALTSENQSAP